MLCNWTDPLAYQIIYTLFIPMRFIYNYDNSLRMVSLKINAKNPKPRENINKSF